MKTFILKDHQQPITVHYADGFADRLIGLMGKTQLADDQGLLLEPCAQIHTFFMCFTIDAVFINKQNKIIKIITLKPWRLSRFVWGSKKVLELTQGTATRIGLHEGQTLELAPC